MSIINDISQKHNINESFQNGKPMDPENRLFVSDSFVLKIYYPRKFEYYKNELEIYNALSNKDNIPKLYFYDENEEYKYIIMSRIKGISLFDSWSKLNNTDRIGYLKQMSQILKDINNIKSCTTKFRNKMEIEFNNLLLNINYSSKTINRMNEIFDENIKYITNDEESSLIHIDTHFYNFMIDENRKLMAYDFENTMMAPRDYQLLRLYRMNYYPESFVYPKDSLSKKEINSYKNVLSVICDNYPELIENVNVDKRIKIYLLNYLLKEAIRCKIPEDRVINLIETNKKIDLRR